MEVYKILRAPFDGVFEGLVKLEESMGTKAILAFVLVISACAMAISQVDLPDWMTQAVTLVVAMYYAGSYALTTNK